jgi:4-amino-4-deoxy-L-arabinose transferase-like glycosyltransferase
MDTSSIRINPKTTIGLLIIVLILALLARVLALQFVDPVSSLRVTESGMVADNMAKGKGFTFELFGTRSANPLRSFMPPLFPAINYAAIRLFADAVRGLSLIHIVLSTATVALLFIVGYKLSDNVFIGLLSAAAFAFYPVLIIMAVYPPSLTLNLFLLLFYLAMIVWLRDRPSPFLALIAGLLLGLGLLARFMFIGLLPITFLWLWLNRPKSLKLITVLSGLILLFALLTMLPWTVRNYRVHQRLVPVATNGGFVFWNGNNPFTTGSGHEVYTKRVAAYLGIEHDPSLPEVTDPWQPYPMPRVIADRAETMDELELDAAFYQAGLHFIRQNPDQWLDLLQAKLIGFWFFRSNIGGTYTASWTQYYKLGYISLLALTIAGAFLTRRQWRSYMLLYLIFAYYTLIYAIFHVQTRYRWEIEPLFFILASATIWWLAERLLHHRPDKTNSTAFTQPD